MVKNFIKNTDYGALFHKAIDLYEKIERENSREAEINNISMGYLEFGSNDGTPLIWAHGSGSSSYEILNVQAGLVEAGYWVIAIDYRGHGRTQIDINSQNTSLYHIADDISALMDHLDIDKAIVGGLSKGGCVAAIFYDTYPKRVLGLLLEDGGSFSNLRLKEDIRLNVVQPGPMPYPIEAVKRLYDTTIRYKDRFEGLQDVLAACSPAVKAATSATVEYITMCLSFLRQEENGMWVYHCDGWRYFLGESGRNVGEGTTSAVLYSRLPLMQQSQELMIPSVVFRNLNVPMHIIDPVSPVDWLPVRHLNEELHALHPGLIVHEVYDYEHSPHEAHLERPRRFIESAKALLKRI